MAGDNEEIVDGETGELVVQSPGALAQLNRAEIDIQISTARAFPRSISTFKQSAEAMATVDEDTAASCFYVLKRSGKKIEGPSARLAEIVALAWTNLRVGARVVADQGSFIVAQGVAHDLEKNTAITIEVTRRITDKKGRRYTDDMVSVASNAAVSIALRNAVFKVIPKAYWAPIYEKARLVSVGNAKTMTERRRTAIEFAGKMGVSEQQVLAALGRTSIEDVTVEDLIDLRGIFQSIKEGETTLDAAFPSGAAAGTNGSKTATDALNEKLAGAAGKQTNGASNGSKTEAAPAAKEPAKPAESAAAQSAPSGPSAADLQNEELDTLMNEIIADMHAAENKADLDRCERRMMAEQMKLGQLRYEKVLGELSKAQKALHKAPAKR